MQQIRQTVVAQERREHGFSRLNIAQCVPVHVNTHPPQTKRETYENIIRQSNTIPIRRDCRRGLVGGIEEGVPRHGGKGVLLDGGIRAARRGRGGAHAVAEGVVGGDVVEVEVGGRGVARALRWFCARIVGQWAGFVW